VGAGNLVTGADQHLSQADDLAVTVHDPPSMIADVAF
jgi:hypothetical protein